MRNIIIGYGLLACVFYIAFLLLMKMLHLAHITELRMVNYLIMCLVCMYEIKRQITRTGAYIPFLQVFFTTFFTGVCSSLFFSAFLFVYTNFDTEMSDLFAQHTPETLRQLPTAVILFEGSAASIAIALINLQYFRRYEETNIPADK